MMTDNKTWEEFCELYFDEAKRYADIHLAKHIEKNGAPNRRVDLSYVKDAAVLAALEKTFTHFDASRGTKITTYLSRIVHNEVIDELTRQSKEAAQEQDLDDVKTAIRAWSADEPSRDNRQLIQRLRAAVDKLSPSDQIILNYYLMDKKTYIARSVQALGTSENYVSLRRFQIFQRLPRLMEMTREQYLRYHEDACESQPGAVLEMMVLRNEDSFVKKSFNRSLLPGPTSRRISKRSNPIQPSLDLDALTASLLREIL